MVTTTHLWLLPLLAWEVAAQSLCSTVNTADGESKSNIYETRSVCSDQCRGQAAYAVVQYDKCWCSDKTPGSTTNDGACNKPCPGYPVEMCGGESQYSYILLDKSRAIAASSPDSTSSQQQQTTPPASRITTATETSNGDTATLIRTTQASASVQTISTGDQPAKFRTITVTGKPVVVTSAAPNTTTPPSGGGASSLKRGAIAGIAIGGSAAGVCLGLAAFLIWRRNQHIRSEDGAQSKEGGGGGFGGVGANDSVKFFGPSSTTIHRDNTTASADSRMGAFGHNKTLWRNSTGSLEDSSSETNQVLRVVNPDMPEKM